MPRMISFSMTTPQFLDGSKDVTRRMGWLTAKAGDELMAVEKAMGLGKGDKVKRLGLIRLIDVRRERLSLMTDNLDYGFAETAREGFPEGHPNNWPSVFVEFFCNGHRGCAPDSIITRIEFRKIALTSAYPKGE